MTTTITTATRSKIKRTSDKAEIVRRMVREGDSITDVAKSLGISYDWAYRLAKGVQYVAKTSTVRLTPKAAPTSTYTRTV